MRILAILLTAMTVTVVMCCMIGEVKVQSYSTPDGVADVQNVAAEAVENPGLLTPAQAANAGQTTLSPDPTIPP